MSHEVTVIGAHPVLRPAVTFYYRLRQTDPVIIDHLRADCGHMRLFLTGGDGYLEWPNGHRAHTHKALFTGPLNHSPRVRVSGPLDFVGFAVMPEAWGAWNDLNASDYADQAVDLRLTVGNYADEMFDAIHSSSNMREMADRFDALLMQNIRPLPHGHTEMIGTIRGWLAERLFPEVDDLYARCDMSSRQVIRIANRYFGAPPKMLARKYGALRTASAMLADHGRPPAEAIEHYADQSHMIRELRQFTGQTPRRLMTQSSPIARATLSLANFGEIVPYA